MYKLVALLGPYLVTLVTLAGGLILLAYLTVRLRLRPYVLVFCVFLLYLPLVKELSIGLGGGLNPTTLMVALLALMWLVQSHPSSIRTPIKALLIVWILINVVSLLLTSLGQTGPHYLDWNLRVLKRMIDAVVLFFFALAIRGEDERKGLIVSICVGVLIVGFHAYVQGITRGGRIPGLLGHPNLTMGFLSAYAPLVLALAGSARTRLWRITMLVVFFIVMTGLFETGSRMGLVAGAIACFAVLFFSGNRWVVVAGLAAAITLVLLPQLMPERIYKRFQGMRGGEYRGSQEIYLDEANPDSSVGSRLAIWKGGLEIIGGRPLLGTGFGRFKTHIEPWVAEFYGEDRTKSAHNAYIQIAAELGIPALIIFLLIFYNALKEARFVFSRHQDPRIQWIARGVFGTGVALLVSNMTSVTFQDTEVMAYFFVLAGIMAVTKSQMISEEEAIVS